MGFMGLGRKKNAGQTVEGTLTRLASMPAAMAALKDPSATVNVGFSCGACGAALSAAIPVNVEVTKDCPKCGASNRVKQGVTYIQM